MKEMASEGHCCHSHTTQSDSIPALGRKLKIVGALFLTVLALSFAAPFQALNESLLEYLQIVWWAVLLGLAFGGVIDYFVPDGFIIRLLGQRRKLTLF
jgi:uncharacterized membrane protein YraQ (UPF0718 family)